MSLNQKPIDAIRREMNRLGYDVSLETNKREISIMLGLNKYSSLKTLCLHLGVEYNSNNHSSGYFPSMRLFLIKIFKPSDIIEFTSSQKILHSLLFGGKYFLKNGRINDIISNQYVFSLDHKYYIISDSPHKENISPNFDSPFMLVTIRQVMKSLGYDITHKTNKKEICAMIGLPSDSTKKEIGIRLDIPYVKTNVGGHQPWRKIQLTNIYDPSHTVRFRSMREGERELNVHHYQLHNYINDPYLTVPYKGNVFTVSFIVEE